MGNASDAILESFIESFKDVLIFSVDTDYRYLFFNSSFKATTFAVYGTEVEKGGLMLDSILRESEKEKAKKACDRALAGESHHTIEVYGTLRPLYFKTRYNPIKDEAGNSIGVTVMAADITESKLAEERIDRLNKELEAFSYSIAHDLRAPLRSIHGFAEILQEEYQSQLDDEARRLLNIISGNSRKMGHMVDGLLHFAKLGRYPLRKTRLSIRDLLPPVLQELTVEMDLTRLTLETETLLDVDGDENLIRNVFINLIANALKYTGKKEKAIIRISSVETNEDVVYSITDNGAGFDMQYTEKLFRVFHRLHKQDEYEGVGVGLAIAHRIITKHEGKIWAVAEVDKGAEFSFSLPKV